MKERPQASMKVTKDHVPDDTFFLSRPTEGGVLQVLWVIPDVYTLK